MTLYSVWHLWNPVQKCVMGCALFEKCKNQKSQKMNQEK